MTKIETLIARTRLVEAAEIAIARQRGIMARAHNRPRTGVLVPKFDSTEQTEAFYSGWDEADARLA